MVSIIMTIIICLTVLACVEIIVNGTEFFRDTQEIREKTKDLQKK